MSFADPVSPSVAIGFAAELLFLRQNERSIEASKSALELDPGFPMTKRWLEEAHLLRCNYQEAEVAFKRIVAPFPGAGFLGYCYARTGRRSEALALLQQLEMSPGNAPAPAYQIAVLQLGLGDTDDAFEWLDRACDLIPDSHARYERSTCPTEYQSTSLSRTGHCVPPG